MATEAPAVKPLPVVCTIESAVGSLGVWSAIVTLRLVPNLGPPASGGKLVVDGSTSTVVTTGATL